jgi:methionyl-tRNA synthetase
MPRKIVVTSALPYANGPIHIGHLVEYIQTDIWVRFQKLCGNQCFYFCADDTHGTPVMISARAKGISPEELIEKVQKEHKADFDGFYVEFDNYYSTHSPENKHFSELIFNRLNQAGSIVKRDVQQAYCPKCEISLPDRFIKGVCPKCKAEDQYGDSCEVCGTTYRPSDLINPYCATCKSTPIQKTSEHYFFKLADYQIQLKELFAAGYIQDSVANKLDEWFSSGLKDWDISRDGPYFGFKIPGEENKFFYVWLDAPVGYMASAKNYCDRVGLDFSKLWPQKDLVANSDGYELYHFIGKDIMYFHALFWPAMLIGAGIKTANKLFVHGFLTVNGQKMSKSRGTFIKAGTYLKHLDPEYLRYYYASKLSEGIDDIDLSVEDFVNKTNSDIVGKFANLASRSVPMLTSKLDSRLGQMDEIGRVLIQNIISAKDDIIKCYENLEYASVIRILVSLADQANRYVEQNQPWAMIKQDPEKTRTTLTTIINAVRALTIYLKPVLPKFAQKVEEFLNIPSLSMADLGTVLENHKICNYVRLVERIEQEKVNAMIEESKDSQAAQPAPPVITAEPIKPECTIDDFAKIDLRIAQVKKAEKVVGADRLLHLVLDVGGIEKNVMAGIATAYKPEDLTGKIVVYLANLKPRQMKFGLSEGMILAAGPGGKDIFMLSVDNGAKPGQKIQ